MPSDSADCLLITSSETKDALNALKEQYPVKAEGVAKVKTQRAYVANTSLYTSTCDGIWQTASFCLDEVPAPTPDPVTPDPVNPPTPDPAVPADPVTPDPIDPPTPDPADPANPADPTDPAIDPTPDPNP